MPAAENDSENPRPIEAAWSPRITTLLNEWGAGDHVALDRLIPLVYDELCRQASRYLRREPVGMTLETSALVHEVYLRLTEQRSGVWESRSQFFGVAAQLMRRILVDHARANQADKRGGGTPASPLIDAVAVPETPVESHIDLLHLDEALHRLAMMNPRQAQVVELRYFTGLSIAETAEVLGVSIGPVKRDWAVARAWLQRELRSEENTENAVPGADSR